MSYQTPASRYQALIIRDPSAANSFIYSVVTTKIYCRPTCPSRLARRANIIFHDNAEQAEAEGFRACLRCRPGTLSGEEGDPQIKAVEMAKVLIEKEGNGEKWSVKALAKEVGLTESHFCRVFKKVEGKTVGEYRGWAYGSGLKQLAGNERQLPDTIIRTNKNPDTPNLQIARTAPTSPGFAELDRELAQDWHDFIGTSYPSICFDMAPNIHLSNFDFGNLGSLTPELLSDHSTPSSLDDGMQFLDFDSHQLVSFPS